jgi:hypothetical protein
MFKPPRGNPASASAAAAVVSPYKYNFYVQDTLYESGSMNQTTSPYWWVNSGAKLILFDGKGETIQGTLPITDPWRIAYATANPRDTDNGAHPQNIFRLVSRSTWNNVRLEASYYIAADNFSPSANRNASNGLLLMSRYSMDGQTLYYAGLRVDGTAILKKKINGAYYTMAQKKIFPGTYSISAANGTSRNLLPHNVWLRLRSDTVTNSDGSVTVKLSMQSPLGSGWQSLLTATDRGEFGGTAPITGARYTGIRTDFMDVKFDDFLAQNL